MPSYKLIIQSGIVRLKTGIGNLLNINGIKDKGTGTGAVTNNLIDWKLLDYSDTAANLALNNYILGVGQKAFTTDLLYPGTNQMRWKVGNGVDSWSDLDYIPYSSGGTGVQSVTGPDVDDNDPQNPIVNTPSLKNVLSAGNTTNNTPIISPDGLNELHIEDGGSFIRYQDGAENSNVSTGPGEASLNYNDGADSGSFVSNPNNSQVNHSQEIQLNSPSVLKNGNEIATQNEVAVVQNDIDTHEANTSNPHNVTKSQVGLGNVDNTSDLDKPVSTAQQTALNTKLSIANNLSDVANSLTARSNLGIYNLMLSNGDQSTSSNVATNITDMVSPTLPANKRYKLSGLIHIGAASSGGVKIQVTIPSGGTIFLNNFGFTLNSGVYSTSILIASATLTTSAFCTNASTVGWIKVDGEVQFAGTPGTIQFGFASGTNGNATTIYQLGTHVELIQVN